MVLSSLAAFIVQLLKRGICDARTVPLPSVLLFIHGQRLGHGSYLPGVRMRLVAKHAQAGYLTPGQRPGCRNCQWSETYRPESGVCYSSPRLQCTKHDVEVSSGAICDSFASPSRGSLNLVAAEVVHQVELPKMGKSHQVARGFGERLLRGRA